MSVYGMTPKFTDYDGYKAWRLQWKSLYATVSKTVRKAKCNTKELQRNYDPLASKAQHDLSIDRSVARKLMMLLDEAKLLVKKLKSMRQNLEAQLLEYPLEMDCPTIDFHFNKGHIQFPDLPMWVIHAKGKSYYVDHVDADVPWSTKEQSEKSTKGLLRFKHCSLRIEENRVAKIKKKVA